MLSVQNIRVSHDTALAHSEPAIAVNPANPNNLIAGSKFFSSPSQYRFKIGTFYSMDGGHTWHDSNLLPGFDDYGTTSDVSITFSPNGTIAYAAVLACNGGVCRGNGNASGIYVSRSRDGGVTWEAPTLVYVDVSGAYFSDKPWIAVDWSKGPTRGTVYVAWNLDGNVNGRRAGDDHVARPFRNNQMSSAPGGIVIARSTDYGATFSSPVTLLAFDSQFKHQGLGAVPQVSATGQVSVVYVRQDDVGSGVTKYSIQHVKSTDRGVTFSTPRTAVTFVSPVPDKLPNSNFRNFSLPAYAVSPKTSAMVVAWSDMRNGDADIYESHSSNGGKSWSTPYRVNHDRINNHKDQFQPALAVAPNGTFTASWFDRRRDPKDHNIDVYVAQSTNDGTTFDHNYRVTARSWDPSVGAPHADGKANTTFIGDYQGLAVSDTTIHPLWNDTQNGMSQEIRTAVISVRLLIRR